MPELLLRPIGGYGWLALLAVLLLSSLWLVRAVQARVSWGKIWTLMFLRLLTIAIALFTMLRPVLIYTEIKKQPSTLVILADTSRSMQIRDALGTKSRWQALKEQLIAAEPALQALGDDVRLKLYTFDAATHVLEFDGKKLKLPDEPTGEQSAIGAALQEALRQSAGQRLAAVVLLSDGAQRALPDRDEPPENAAAMLASEGVPLYTIGFGEPRGPGQGRDIAVDKLVVNPTVYVKNTLEVSATVRIDGFVNKGIDVELLWETAPGKMTPVGTPQTLRTAVDGALQPVTFDYTPEVPGEYKLTVRAKPQDGELVVTNNELSTFVSVLKGGVSVLYLEGEPRPEQKYLRWSLGSTPNVELDVHIIDARSPNPLPANAAEWFAPGKYDVIIIGDVDRIAFNEATFLALSKAVKENRTGLMMLGGLHSFGAGGWQTLGPQPALERESLKHETDLFKGVLPLALGRLERQGFDEPIRADLHLPGLQQMQPTRQGERHFVMLLAPPGQNADAWKKLPPLDGANKFSEEMTPLAEVLAVNAQGKPLLVAQEVGGGRVMAFAGDSTWRWWLHGHQDAHRRFWRQVILWLAHRDAEQDSSVWIKLADRRFRRGQRVDMTIGANSPTGQPLPAAEYKAEVVLPDGQKRELFLSRQSTDMSGSFLETQLPGDYTVEVTASDAGQLVGMSRARFLVLDQDLELDNPAANLDLLARLATMTKGKPLASEQLPALFEQLKAQGLSVELPLQTKQELWDNWTVFLIFVGLLALEWFLRKRWSLV